MYSAKYMTTLIAYIDNSVTARTLEVV